ncbi:MAG: thioesterase [Deltaproteobacteria bacterium RBG_13_49_15]|nr:MAG: thioesterase [Deltaproteobacteria bacterium RBG_13_49_15]
MKADISEERRAFLKTDFSRGFIRYCRFEAEKIGRGYFQSKVTIKKDHLQQDGFIHAGVMAAMADHTAGYAAFTVVSERIQILTVEFKINFLKPASGDTLICRATVIREGKQLIVSESEVFDIKKGAENLVAKALVTLMAVPKEKIAIPK